MHKYSNGLPTCVLFSRMFMATPFMKFHWQMGIFPVCFVISFGLCVFCRTSSTKSIINLQMYSNKHSKMPTVRNARSLDTSRELPSGLQIWGESPLSALFSVDADTDSSSEESVKVIQGRVAHGTLYVRLTCPTMDNRHNKLSQVPEF